MLDEEERLKKEKQGKRDVARAKVIADKAAAERAVVEEAESKIKPTL